MSRNEDVYTIADDQILESMRKELERKGAMRPAPASTSDGAPRATSRSKIRYAQPPASGSRALLASTMSLFICGAGQAYNGQGQMGALLFLTETFLVALNWSLCRMWPEVKELADVFGVTDLQILLTMATLDFLLVFLAMTAVYQAYRQAERDDGQFGGKDNPILSGMASLIIPGWGQLVNGQPGKAVAFLFFGLTGVFTVVLLVFTPFLAMLNEVNAWRDMSTQLNTGVAAVLAAAGIIWILSIYDAMLVAGFRRKMS